MTYDKMLYNHNDGNFYGLVTGDQQPRKSLVMRSMRFVAVAAAASLLCFFALSAAPSASNWVHDAVDQVVMQPATGLPTGLPSAGPLDPSTLADGTWNNIWNVTQEEFNLALTLNGYPTPTLNQWRNFAAKAGLGRITSKRELAMFLAQTIHESGGLLFKTERGCPDGSWCSSYQFPSWNPNLCGPQRNQPCRQQPNTPSTLYYGRGYIQLSWPVNYEAASWRLYGDNRLYVTPDTVSSTEWAAWDTAYWYWRAAVHDAPGVTDGRFGSSTRAINGALECNGVNTELAISRFRKYRNVFRAFKVAGTPIEGGCYN